MEHLNSDRLQGLYWRQWMITPLVLFIVFVVNGTIQGQESSLDKIRALQEELTELAIQEEQRQEKAAEVSDTKVLQSNINTVWLIVSGCLVFFMQAGFCMLEMGFSRAKNTINVAMKNLLDFSAASIFYLLFGFTIMFGASETGWIGGEGKWLANFDATSPLWSLWFFQAMFAATACTIASGAMAERTKFISYLVYVIVFAGFIYPIFGHWAWGSAAGGLEPGFGGSMGWLEQLGFHDFAGSTVVHGIGGASALAGIIVLGARVDKFDKDGKPLLLVGHSLPLASLGLMILWMGWFGFNAGSLGHASDLLGRICVNTAISASAGAFVSMLVFWKLMGIPNVVYTINGILGGLVAITACADCVTPISAIAIGAIAGLVSSLGSLFLEYKMRLDDVVGAIPVHLFNGIWGTLAVAIFHENGFSADQLGRQAFGVLAISSGAFIAAFVLFKILDVSIGLRASDEDQEDGLDFAEHSSNAYPDFKTTER